MTATAPVQSRSKKTLKSILSATESLLEVHSFDQITIADIVSQAGCTTGSFYARFDSKEALLPALYDNYDKALPSLFTSLLQRQANRSPSLADLLTEIASAVAKSYSGQPNLMRAVIWYARTQPDTIDQNTLHQRQELVTKIVDLFAPLHDEIPHGVPARAIQFALFTLIAALRDRILFPDAPNANILKASEAEFIKEAAAMAIAYLKYP